MHLERGREIVGRIQVPEGSSAEGWQVEFEASDGSWADGTIVRLDGTFGLANVPPTRGRVMLWTDKTKRLPFLVQSVLEIGRPEVVFDLTRDEMDGGAHGAMTGSFGGEANGTMQIWQGATGRGTTLRASSAGRFSVRGLSRGSYRTFVNTGVGGMREGKERWLDGRELIDLGLQPQHEPVQVRVDLAAASPTGAREVSDIEFYRRGGDVDVRHVVAREPGQPALISPGSWVLLWRQSGVLRARRMRVLPGRELVIRLDERSR